MYTKQMHLRLCITLLTSHIFVISQINGPIRQTVCCSFEQTVLL